MRQHLPIGTVVNVKQSDQNFMIVSQFPLTVSDGEEGYFDFGAVCLPYGLTDTKLFYFNKEDISKLVFVGYIDAEFQNFLTNYDQLVEKISYKKLSIQSEEEVNEK